MQSQIGSIAVVGAGLAGARCVAELQAAGFDGTIHLIGDEDHVPYNRPPLSKGTVIFGSDEDRLPASLDVKVDLSCVELHLQTRAIGLGDRAVLTTRGSIEADAVIIATGAKPLRLNGEGRQHVLRTRDDALSLREAARNSDRIVVIGASWLGAEVASAAQAAGCEVTCLETSTGPLARSLGPVGERTMGWWGDIDLRLGARVMEVSSTGVVLEGQETLQADLVLSAIGCRPDVEWLSGSGLTLAEGGIVVDDQLLALLPEGHPWSGRIAAVGDVCVWPSARYKRNLRVEHWDNALQGPRTAVGALLGHGVPPFDPVPYFWSEQFGHRLQFVGQPSAQDRVVVREKGDTWSVLWLRGDDTLGACLAVDAPQDVMQARQVISSGATVGMASAGRSEVPIRELGLGD